ncbi:MAG: hypothetical protein A4E51_01262 [Methanosaeta sp. PtaU1.Bin055]|nr:MAG: hypothetical protein A4E51_01262 [Methanosaeta sp. PtaU1.Bin055]
MVALLSAKALCWWMLSSFTCFKTTTASSGRSPKDSTTFWAIVRTQSSTNLGLLWALWTTSASSGRLRRPKTRELIDLSMILMMSSRETHRRSQTWIEIIPRPRWL